MHISVTVTGTVEVHGSRRVAAHLHGLELSHTAAVVAAVVRNGLVAAGDLPALEQAVRTIQPDDLAGWQTALAAIRSPELLSVAARAYRAAKAKDLRQTVQVRLSVEPAPLAALVYVYRP